MPKSKPYSDRSEQSSAPAAPGRGKRTSMELTDRAVSVSNPLYQSAQRFAAKHHREPSDEHTSAFVPGTDVLGPVGGIRTIKGFQRNPMFDTGPSQQAPPHVRASSGVGEAPTTSGEDDTSEELPDDWQHMPAAGVVVSHLSNAHTVAADSLVWTTSTTNPYTDNPISSESGGTPLNSTAQYFQDRTGRVTQEPKGTRKHDVIADGDGHAEASRTGYGMPTKEHVPQQVQLYGVQGPSPQETLPRVRVKEDITSGRQQRVVREVERTGRLGSMWASSRRGFGPSQKTQRMQEIEPKMFDTVSSLDSPIEHFYRLPNGEMVVFERKEGLSNAPPEVQPSHESVMSKLHQQVQGSLQALRQLSWSPRAQIQPSHSIPDTQSVQDPQPGHRLQHDPVNVLVAQRQQEGHAAGALRRDAGQRDTNHPHKLNTSRQQMAKNVSMKGETQQPVQRQASRGVSHAIPGQATGGIGRNPSSGSELPAIVQEHPKRHASPLYGRQRNAKPSDSVGKMRVLCVVVVVLLFIVAVILPIAITLWWRTDRAIGGTTGKETPADGLMLLEEAVGNETAVEVDSGMAFIEHQATPDQERRVVCYQASQQLAPHTTFDLAQCTDVVYSHVGFDSVTSRLLLKPADEVAVRGLRTAVRERARQTGAEIKVLLGVGASAYDLLGQSSSSTPDVASQSRSFASILRETGGGSAHAAAFDSIVETLQSFDVDGVDLLITSLGSQQPSAAKTDVTNFVQDLRARLWRERSYLLDPYLLAVSTTSLDADMVTLLDFGATVPFISWLTILPAPTQPPRSISCSNVLPFQLPLDVPSGIQTAPCDAFGSPMPLVPLLSHLRASGIQLQKLVVALPLHCYSFDLVGRDGELVVLSPGSPEFSDTGIGGVVTLRRVTQLLHDPATGVVDFDERGQFIYATSGRQMVSCDARQSVLAKLGHMLAQGVSGVALVAPELGGEALEDELLLETLVARRLASARAAQVSLVESNNTVEGGDPLVASDVDGTLPAEDISDASDTLAAGLHLPDRLERSSDEGGVSPGPNRKVEQTSPSDHGDDPVATDGTGSTGSEGEEGSGKDETLAKTLVQDLQATFSSEMPQSAGISTSGRRRLLLPDDTSGDADEHERDLRYHARKLLSDGHPLRAQADKVYVDQPGSDWRDVQLGLEQPVTAVEVDKFQQVEPVRHIGDYQQRDALFSTGITASLGRTAGGSTPLLDSRATLDDLKRMAWWNPVSGGPHASTVAAEYAGLPGEGQTEQHVLPPTKVSTGVGWALLPGSESLPESYLGLLAKPLTRVQLIQEALWSGARRPPHATRTVGVDEQAVGTGAENGWMATDRKLAAFGEEALDFVLGNERVVGATLGGTQEAPGGWGSDAVDESVGALDAERDSSLDGKDLENMVAA